MVKHIILWQFKDELSEEEKLMRAKEIKAGLEGLKGKVEGLEEITVQTEKLATSNADVMLDCTLKDEKALAVYAKYPEHVAVAENKIKPFIKTRICMDFEVK